MTVSLTWIEAVALASVRLVTFLVIAPPFSHGAVPLRIKGMLGVGIALAVSPRLVPGYSSLDTGGFLLALLAEALIGAVLGFLVMVAFSAVQAAGGLIDLFGGFQLAQAFDPQSLVNGAQFARLFQLTAVVLLFVSGGYQLIVGGLVRSFTALPLGGRIDLGSSANAMVDGVTQMTLSALQIAGPLIAVLFLADVGLGLLTRVAPALNAFVLGFPLKIILTIALVALGAVALPQLVGSLTGTAVHDMLGVR
jgi:flagellar biosynthetic protein FliR